jgi:hypothetical protein
VNCVYAIIVALGAALSVAVWLPWRARHPRKVLRAIATTLLVVATGYGVAIVNAMAEIEHTLGGLPFIVVH